MHAQSTAVTVLLPVPHATVPHINVLVFELMHPVQFVVARQAEQLVAEAHAQLVAAVLVGPHVAAHVAPAPIRLTHQEQLPLLQGVHDVKLVHVCPKHGIIISANNNRKANWIDITKYALPVWRDACWRLEIQGFLF